MKSDGFDNQQSLHDLQDEIASASDKDPYSSPVLKIYGSVSKLTMGNNGTIVDTGMPTMMTASDRRIKKNAIRIGGHPLGIGLYLFDYKPEFCDEWGFGKQFGVMADEVETVMPHAVVVHPDGYKMVNYGMLGIDRTPH